MILPSVWTSSPPFSQFWFDWFKTRHPEITLAKAQKLNLLKARATSEPVIDQYFQDLKYVMGLHGIHSKPEHIWNIDETGLMMEHSPSLVICGSGTKPQAVTSHRGKNITIIATGKFNCWWIPSSLFCLSRQKIEWPTWGWCLPKGIWNCNWVRPE